MLLSDPHHSAVFSTRGRKGATHLDSNLWVVARTHRPFTLQYAGIAKTVITAPNPANYHGSAYNQVRTDIINEI
jgi:hypothetical protein